MLSPGAKCATHPIAEAVDTCTRCGNFVCAGCLEVEEWDSYCTECYARVGSKAPASTMATTALVLGILSISGCVPLAIPALIIGHMEVAAIDRGESEPGGRNLAQGAIYIGWIITGLSVLGILFVLAFGLALT